MKKLNQKQNELTEKIEVSGTQKRRAEYRGYEIVVYQQDSFWCSLQIFKGNKMLKELRVVGFEERGVGIPHKIEKSGYTKAIEWINKKEEEIA